MSCKAIVHTLIVAAALFYADGSTLASRILWRVPLPGQYVPVRPVLSPDGETIYVLDLSGDLHAVDPDGWVRWTVEDVGNQGVDVSQDGTVYAGDERHVVALYPDGSDKWTYPIPHPRPIVAYGPAVGPEGNIYHVGSDGSGDPQRGPFSLTPDGELRWETPVWFRPTVAWSQLAFGPKSGGGGYQMVYVSGSHLARVDTEAGEIDMIGGGAAGKVVVNKVGNIYFGGTGYDPDGNVLFATANIIEAAANNGDVYSVWAGLNRLDPWDGSTIWNLNTPGGWNGNISPTPADDLLLCRGPGNAYQPPGTIRAASTDGEFLWSNDLPVDDGRVSAMGTQAVYSPDGRTAYVGSTTLFQGYAQTCYLYAIDVAPETVGVPEGPAPGAAPEITTATPNPVNSSATIRFELPATHHIRLGIYDVAGRLVYTPFEGKLPAGRHAMTWNGKDTTGRTVPAGVYFARLVAGGDARSRKLVVAR